MKRYKTVIKGNDTFRVIYWKEEFKDESTNESVFVTRSIPIKKNGKRCNMFGSYEPVVDRFSGKYIWKS